MSATTASNCFQNPKEGSYRDLSDYNSQYDKSVIELAAATGEAMPTKARLARLDEDKNPDYTYTEKVVDGEEQLDALINKGKPILVEEEYYNASNQAYDQLAQSEGNAFLRLSTNSKIRKIQSLLLQQYILNAELLLYLDESNGVPPANAASDSVPPAPATQDDSTAPDAPVVPYTSTIANVPPVVALNGLDAGALATKLASNAGGVTFVNVQPGAQNIGVQNNNTGGGGTPEWAKRLMVEQQRQGGEQQFQGGQLRELHKWTSNKKAPPSASRYTPHDPENLANMLFESNSSSPE